MQFKTHFIAPGAHATLSASKYQWLNYDDDKIAKMLVAANAAKRGTELHALAHELIRLGIKLPRNSKTLNLYVNDAIGFRMTPEQTLYYSDDAYGTPDAIAFSEAQQTLRISDLKTGVGSTSEKQLEIYAAFFCLEYGYRPFDIRIELRIYQLDEVREYLADPIDIAYIMDRIVTVDRFIKELRKEQGL